MLVPKIKREEILQAVSGEKPQLYLELEEETKIGCIEEEDNEEDEELKADDLLDKKVNKP